MPGTSSTESRHGRILYYTDVKMKEGLTEKQVESLRFTPSNPAPTTLSGKAGLLYYRYRLITGTDMLNRWERTVFNILAVVFLGLVFYNFWMSLYGLLTKI